MYMWRFLTCAFFFQCIQVFVYAGLLHLGNFWAVTIPWGIVVWYTAIQHIYVDHDGLGPNSNQSGSPFQSVRAPFPISPGPNSNQSGAPIPVSLGPLVALVALVAAPRPVAAQMALCEFCAPRLVFRVGRAEQRPQVALTEIDEAMFFAQENHIRQR